MINVFLLDYYSRLRAWHQLKENLKDADLQTIAVEVDKFWQQCPMSHHYLHPADTPDWPSPWELINDNTYCVFARALGMFYTLLLLGVENIDIVEAIDDNNEDVCLVTVDHAKYILNYHPNMVVNMKLSDFTNIKQLDTIPLKKKIGEE